MALKLIISIPSDGCQGCEDQLVALVCAAPKGLLAILGDRTVGADNMTELLHKICQILPGADPQRIIRNAAGGEREDAGGNVPARARDRRLSADDRQTQAGGYNRNLFHEGHRVRRTRRLVVCLCVLEAVI